jgi:hypothetical protein
MATSNHILLKNGRRIFFARGLDRLFETPGDLPVGQSGAAQWRLAWAQLVKSKRSPGKRSATRDSCALIPASRCAHVGYSLLHQQRRRKTKDREVHPVKTPAESVGNCDMPARRGHMGTVSPVLKGSRQAILLLKRSNHGRRLTARSRHRLTHLAFLVCLITKRHGLQGCMLEPRNQRLGLAPSRLMRQRAPSRCTARRQIVS